ncbi:methyltransferase, partial [Sansalvadorimonas verongulae]|uniref:methyltransferase n=1 Tax=Sansalvadorimonas verongulae TaxID=2172824 RepID=UPI0012BD6D78
GIGPVPSNRYVKKQLLTALPESVTGDILELGAGWGGISLALAKAYPSNKVIAVENSLPVWLFCWLRVMVWRVCGKVTNLEVQLCNINHTDLQSAGLIYCYLYPGAMKRLSSRLQELSPGCALISNTFSLPGLAPEKCLQAADVWRSQIFCYRL